MTNPMQDPDRAIAAALSKQLMPHPQGLRSTDPVVVKRWRCEACAGTGADATMPNGTCCFCKGRGWKWVPMALTPGEPMWELASLRAGSYVAARDDAAALTRDGTLICCNSTGIPGLGWAMCPYCSNEVRQCDACGRTMTYGEGVECFRGATDVPGAARLWLHFCTAACAEEKLARISQETPS